MKALVSSELEWVPETDCKDRLARLLVEPTFVALAWEYGAIGATRMCCIVARLEDGDQALVYCEDGFGPREPWGAVLSVRRRWAATISGTARCTTRRSAQGFAPPRMATRILESSGGDERQSARLWPYWRGGVRPVSDSRPRLRAHRLYPLGAISDAGDSPDLPRTLRVWSAGRGCGTGGAIRERRYPLPRSRGDTLGVAIARIDSVARRRVNGLKTAGVVVASLAGWIALGLAGGGLE